MNRVLGHLFTHVGKIGPGEQPEDGEMNETTLPSASTALVVWGRARYLSVTDAPQNTEYLLVSGEETFCSFETWMPERGSNPRSPSQAV